MTDISDPQMGELLQNPIRKEVKHREMLELMDAPAVFADRLYIIPKTMAVTLSFCEDIPNADENKVRARIALSVQAFVQFSDMMAVVAKQIRDAQAKQQAQAEANDIGKKGMN